MIELLPQIKFRSQKDPIYEPLKAAGFFSKLEESGLCWLACAEMAVSPILPPDSLRQFVTEYAMRVKNELGLNEAGQVMRESLTDNAEILRQMVKVYALPVRIDTEKLDLYPFLEHLLNKDALILAVANSDKTVHTLVMDSIYFSHNNEMVLGFWNPIFTNEFDGRKFITPEQLDYRAQNGGVEIVSPVIAFSYLQ